MICCICSNKQSVVGNNTRITAVGYTVILFTHADALRKLWMGTSEKEFQALIENERINKYCCKSLNNNVIYRNQVSTLIRGFRKGKTLSNDTLLYPEHDVRSCYGDHTTIQSCSVNEAAMKSL